MATFVSGNLQDQNARKLEIVVTKSPSVRSPATNAYNIILDVNQRWANDCRLDYCFPPSSWGTTNALAPDLS